MVLILTLNVCSYYPKQSSKYRSKDGTRKKHRYWWKITNKRQYTIFIGTILKEQWDLLENKNRIKTVKAEINTKNFLFKFGKQKCTVINKYQEINNLPGEV